jgi:hypothetical protein
MIEIERREFRAKFFKIILASAMLNAPDVGI